MIRSRNPRIDVAALEAEVADELAREPQAGANERLTRLAAAVHIRSIEHALDNAEQRSEPRTEWPADVRVFGLQHPKLRRFVLKLMALAFRDQHDANAQLIRAQRETLALVHGLLERIEALEVQLEGERAATRAQRRAQRDHGE
jgi:hypothetical protein